VLAKLAGLLKGLLFLNPIEIESGNQELMNGYLDLIFPPKADPQGRAAIDICA
jgi:hypothetical protein